MCNNLKIGAILGILVLFVLTACDPIKTLVVQNDSPQPIQVLLKGHKRDSSVLNSFEKDTLLVLGTTDSLKRWTAHFSIGSWSKEELGKAVFRFKNSLYLEVYDFKNQRLQAPKIKVMRKGWSKNTLYVKVKK